MNSILFKRTSFVLSLAALTVISSGLKAQAQTTNLAATDVKTNSTLDTTTLTSASALMAEPSLATVVAQADGTVAPDGTTPGTLRDGTTPDTTPGTEPGATPTTPAPGVVEPGRATRSGPSYVGAAGNIGLTGGETALGIGNFAVISKIGLTEAVSARPAVVFGDDTTVLIPVTYDFTLQPTGVATEVVSSFAPYLGGGLAIATGSNSDVGPLLTAGVDVPLGSRLTGTAGVNVGFFDNTSVGLLIGVGYNFEGL